MRKMASISFWYKKSGHRYPISAKIYAKIHTPSQLAALRALSNHLSLHISSECGTCDHMIGLNVSVGAKNNNNIQNKVPDQSLKKQ